VTAPGAPVHFDVTRIALIDALGDMPVALGAWRGNEFKQLDLEARGRMADALLAQMPVASPLVTEEQAREIMQQQVEAQKPRLLAEVAAATDERLQESMKLVRRETLLAFAADLDSVGFREPAALAREAAEADGAPL
jgi:type VI protein secretion system component VasK